MTFIFAERPVSRDSTAREPTSLRRYYAQGEHDAAAVEAYAGFATPGVVSTAWGIVYRQDIRVRSEGHKLYGVEVTYGKNKKETGSLTLSFSTQGGTATRRWSYNQTIYPPGAFNPMGLIGVNGDNVDGCSVVIPALKLTARFRYPMAVITQSQIALLSRITGTVNNGSFLGWAAGEVLYQGMSGSEGTDSETEISHDFAIEPNETGLSVGDVTGIDKDGWDYMWIRWKPAEDGGAAGQQPEAVYVDQVYRRVNLAAYLGFG